MYDTVSVVFGALVGSWATMTTIVTAAEIATIADDTADSLNNTGLHSDENDEE